MNLRVAASLTRNAIVVRRPERMEWAELPIGMEDLFDVLHTDDEFCAQTTSKIDSIVDMLQIGDQPELVDDEPDVAGTLFPA